MQRPPGAPRNLTANVICDRPGSRTLEFKWDSPVSSDCAPVRRYVVAVFDPTYGRAITVATLEPDYDEKLHRFVPVEELRSYVLSEAELQKMPRLFQQPKISVQVAA